MRLFCYFLWRSLNLFILDSTPTGTVNLETETGIKDNKKQKAIKVIAGSSVSCITHWWFLYLRFCTFGEDPTDCKKFLKMKLYHSSK